MSSRHMMQFNVNIERNRWQSDYCVKLGKISVILLSLIYLFLGIL